MSTPPAVTSPVLISTEPSPLTVKAGTKVTWANEDDAMHEPASGTESSPTDVFDVTLDGKGSNASFTFAKAGTYAYYCKIHTSMSGEIIVT